VEIKVQDPANGHVFRFNPEHHRDSLFRPVPVGGSLSTSCESVCQGVGFATLPTAVTVSQVNCGEAFRCGDDVVNKDVPC
jgi:hypothetical protein